MNDILESNTMVSLSSLWFTMFTLVVLRFINLVILLSSPEMLSMHPYKILIHFHLQGNRFVHNPWTIFLFLSKANVRRSVVREMHDLLLRLKESFGVK